MTGQSAGEDAWLEEFPSRLTGLIDLICFPGAGAGASAFLPWRAGLPAFATVLACQLPGREGRIDEPPVESLSKAAGAVVDAYLRKRPRARPVLLFGHSMGGTLAFEATRHLSEAGRTPAALLISASRPPKPGRGATIHRRELENLLLSYDPENVAIIGSPELSASLMPILESDIGLLRSHEPARSGVALDIPVWLLHGSDDPVVSAEDVAGWASFFTGRVTFAEMPGEHQFPFRASRDELLKLVARILREAAG